MQHMFKHAPDYRYDEADFRLIADGINPDGRGAARTSSSISATRLLHFPEIVSAEGQQERQQHVLDVVLARVPEPTETTPWEAVLDFRSDPEARARYLGLKRWMNKLARDTLPIGEIEEEIDYLMNEYERHMKVHKMKFRHGMLRSMITMPFEIAENVIKLEVEGYSGHSVQVDGTQDRLDGGRDESAGTGGFISGAGPRTVWLIAAIWNARRRLRGAPLRHLLLQCDKTAALFRPYGRISQTAALIRIASLSAR